MGKMKSRLVKEMYMWKGKKRPSTLFGISYGAVMPRDFRFAKNAGWYNKEGEELGFGDLSPQNIEKLKNELLPGELFIILYEEDSWERTINEAHKRNPKKIGKGKAPGPLYVASRAWIIVAEKVVYEVQTSAVYLKGMGMRLGVPTKIISCDEAIGLILKNKKPE
jgi:hypothetical protein